MTELLEKAIAKTRALPEAEQDAIALIMLDALEPGGESVSLDAHARAAIDEGLAQARRGEFAPDEEIAALWRRHGLRACDTLGERNAISNNAFLLILTRTARPGP